MIENNQTNSKRGGARKNAGRKPGAATTKTREIANKACESGLTPLEYMLTVMRSDATEPRERLSAAVAAAPYVHAKLASIELTGKDGGPMELVGMTKEQRDAAVAAASRADA